MVGYDFTKGRFHLTFFHRCEPLSPLLDDLTKNELFTCSSVTNRYILSFTSLVKNLHLHTRMGGTLLLILL